MNLSSVLNMRIVIGDAMSIKDPRFLPMYCVGCDAVEELRKKRLGSEEEYVIAYKQRELNKNSNRKKNLYQGGKESFLLQHLIQILQIHLNQFYCLQIN